MTVPPAADVKAVQPRLWWSFILIVAGFVLSAVVSIYEIRNSQAEVRLITRFAADNIESLSRLSHNLDHKQLLVENHVFEKDRKDMNRIEAQLADVDAGIAAMVRLYQPIGDEDEERTLWQQLQQAITEIQPPTIGIISLSRTNRDREAQAAIESIETSYRAIGRMTDRLLALNRDRAGLEVAHVRALQRYGITSLAVLTVLSTVFALATARWVTRLVSERERQLNRAVTLLEERNQELDAFAGRLANDLRGPLTTINLAAASIDQARPGTEPATGSLRRGVAKMEAIIEDLLTLSRISAHAVGATCQTAQVAEFTREDLVPKVEAIGGSLHLDVADAIVPCSEGLLRRVLWNLGENAVKYRRPDAQLQIEIIGHVTTQGYEFRFSDNGAGMSPAEARHAFEPFFRGGPARSTPGTGLGLTVVKRVIEVSGGTVAMESTAGRGTVFEILLPAASSKAA